MFDWQKILNGNFYFFLSISLFSSCVFSPNTTVRGKLEVYSQKPVILKDRKGKAVKLNSGLIEFDIESKNQYVDSLLVLRTNKKEKALFKIPKEAFHEDGSFVPISPEISGQPYTVKLNLEKTYRGQGPNVKGEVACTYIGKCAENKNELAKNSDVKLRFDCPGTRTVEFTVHLFDVVYEVNLAEASPDYDTVAYFRSVPQRISERHRISPDFGEGDLTSCKPKSTQKIKK